MSQDAEILNIKAARQNGTKGRFSNLYSSSAFQAEIEHWLKWQCSMLSGVHSGAVVLLTGEEQVARTVFWPSSDLDKNNFNVAVAKALKSGEAVLHKASSTDFGEAEVLDYLATPMLLEGQCWGVVIIALQIRPEHQMRAVEQLLQWGQVWLDRQLLAFQKHPSGQNQVALRAVEYFLDPQPLAINAHHLCNYLAQQFNCSQVVVGLCHREGVRVTAMSEQLGFDPRAVLLKKMAKAMEESLDQAESICLSESQITPYISKAHVDLLHEVKAGSVFSVPLLDGDKQKGCVLLLRRQAPEFSVVEQDSLQLILTKIGSALARKQDAEQPILQVIGKRLSGVFDSRRRNTVLAVLVLSLLVLTLTETDYRVSARAEVEGRIQQAVSAPFAGYLESVAVRPGDRVSQGESMAALDRSEFLVEQERWLLEKSQLITQYHQALALNDRPQVGILQEKIGQVEATLELVDGQISRASLTAPFDGIVLQGDLSQSVGRAVKQGELLFQLSPLDGFRVVLEVNELDIARFNIGQQGYIRLSGYPDSLIPCAISRIIPIAIAGQGTASFRVEAQLEDSPITTQPGMKGVASITTGKASLLRAWGQGLYDRIRFWFWTIGI